MKFFIVWLARIMAISLILFISIFALEEWTNPVGLFMQLIPSLILLILTLIAWKKPKIGGILYLGIGIVMTLFYHSVWIASPAFVIGFLFWMSYFF